MKFIVNSTELLEHLLRVSKVIDYPSKEFRLNIDELIAKINAYDITGLQHSENVVYHKNYQLYKTSGDKTQLNAYLYSLYTGSVKVLLRQMRLYSSAAISLFNYYRLSIFTSITLLFGLCCSSPGYAFDAIVSSCSTRIPSL